MTVHVSLYRRGGFVRAVLRTSDRIVWQGRPYAPTRAGVAVSEARQIAAMRRWEVV